jgi:hypothetical protein
MGSGDSGMAAEEGAGDLTSRRSPETLNPGMPGACLRGAGWASGEGGSFGAFVQLRGTRQWPQLVASGPTSADLGTWSRTSRETRSKLDAESGGYRAGFRSRMRCLFAFPLPPGSCALEGRAWILPRSARWTPWLAAHALAARERFPIDLDEHEGVMPCRTIHPGRRRGGSRTGMDALPHAGRREAITPARRRLTRAFLEAFVREGVHDLLGHRDPAVLLHHP